MYLILIRNREIGEEALFLIYILLHTRELKREIISEISCLPPLLLFLLLPFFPMFYFIFSFSIDRRQHELLQFSNLFAQMLPDLMQHFNLFISARCQYRSKYSFRQHFPNNIATPPDDPTLSTCKTQWHSIHIKNQVKQLCYLQIGV